MLRFRLFAIVGMVLTSFVLIACGGDDDDEPTDCCGKPSDADAISLVKVVGTTNFGSILATADGRTLYTFTQDTPGKSTCSGACAVTWPPLTTTEPAAPKVANAAGEFSLIPRADGSSQVAFNGKPLYRYGPDKDAGEYAGEGVGGVWFIAKASGSPAAPPPATSTAGSDPYGY